MTKNAWDSSLNQMKSHHKWCDFDEAFTSITRLRLFTNMIQEAAAQLNDWVNLLTLWCNNQNLANRVPEASDNVAFTFTCAKRRSFIGIAIDLYITFNSLPKENILQGLLVN